MKNLEDVYKDEDGPALVFQCHNGKDRTTTAMAIAGLFVCHVKVNELIHTHLKTHTYTHPCATYT